MISFVGFLLEATVLHTTELSAPHFKTKPYNQKYLTKYFFFSFLYTSNIGSKTDTKNEERK